MGLDMYLSAKKYLWSFNDADTQVAKEIQEKINVNRRVKEVVIEAAYWRKANQIHNWFVENIQDGMDECKPHYVSREQLGGHVLVASVFISMGRVLVREGYIQEASYAYDMAKYIYCSLQAENEVDDDVLDVGCPGAPAA